MHINRSYISYCILFVAILFSASFIFWGRGTTDTYYWLHSFQQPLKPGLSDGTWITGHLWCELFGYNVLAYRILEWICSIGAISIPFVVYFNNGGWKKQKPMLSFSLALILMGYGTLMEFSPGTLSFLFLSLTVVSLILWTRKNSIFSIILLGCSSAFAVFCRFPNVISVLFVAAYLAYISSEEKNSFSRIKPLLMYILVFISIYSISYLLSHNDTLLLKQTSAAFSHAAVEEHSLSVLMTKMLNEANELLVFAGLIILISLFPIATGRTKSVWLQLTTSTIGIILLLYILRSNIGTHVRGNRQLQECISVLCVLFVFMKCHLRSVNSKELAFWITCILVLAVEPLGSDTGWVKLFPAMLILLPLSLPEIDQFWSNKLAIAMMITLCIYSTCCFFRNNISGITRDGIWEMQEKTDKKVLKGILLSHNDIEVINTVCNDYDIFGIKDNTIFYGFNAHFFYAITECVPIYNQYGFWMHQNNEKEIANIISVLSENGSALFDYEKNDSKLFVDAISNLDYEMVHENYLYKIYRKKGDINH